jgi:hypothetical protein
MPTQPPQPSGETPTTAGGGDDHFLDEETPSVDGAEAGRHVADAYRNGGSGSAGGGRNLRARPKSPRDLARPEMPAVATLRYLMNAEANYKKKSGRYGNLKEMIGAQALFMPMQRDLTERTFMRKGYRFELTVEADDYRVTATPVTPGYRPFIGDDSDYIRAGVD